MIDFFPLTLKYLKDTGIKILDDLDCQWKLTDFELCRTISSNLYTITEGMIKLKPNSIDLIIGKLSDPGSFSMVCQQLESRRNCKIDKLKVIMFDDFKVTRRYEKSFLITAYATFTQYHPHTCEYIKTFNDNFINELLIQNKSWKYPHELLNSILDSSIGIYYIRNEITDHSKVEINFDITEFYKFYCKNYSNKKGGKGCYHDPELFFRDTFRKKIDCDKCIIKDPFTHIKSAKNHISYLISVVPKHYEIKCIKNYSKSRKWNINNMI